MSFHYSKTETNDKKYTVSQAIDAATAIVKTKRPNIGICLTSIRGKDRKELITLKQLNELSDTIAYDSFYHA